MCEKLKKKDSTNLYICTSNVSVLFFLFETKKINHINSLSNSKSYANSYTFCLLKASPTIN